jgi:hypothetical protein
MGHAAPRHNHRPLTNEDFQLGIARSAFLNGSVDVEEFERDVEQVLRGGTSNPWIRRGDTRLAMPETPPSSFGVPEKRGSIPHPDQIRPLPQSIFITERDSERD